jgi:hypothetical protein
MIRHIDSIVQDDGVRHQVVILYSFLLLFRIVLADDAFSSKEEPFEKP